MLLSGPLSSQCQHFIGLKSGPKVTMKWVHILAEDGEPKLIIKMLTWQPCLFVHECLNVLNLQYTNRGIIMVLLVLMVSGPIRDICMLYAYNRWCIYCRFNTIAMQHVTKLSLITFNSCISCVSWSTWNNSHCFHSQSKSHHTKAKWSKITL